MESGLSRGRVTVSGLCVRGVFHEEDCPVDRYLGQRSIRIRSTLGFCDHGQVEMSCTFKMTVQWSVIKVKINQDAKHIGILWSWPRGRC